MTELEQQLWCERYRPRSFEELILEDKSKLLKYLEQPKSIPSFIFYSSKPGTGKTSTAKIIISELKADYLIINSSEERGIDVIREKINIFARGMSSNPDIKRCVFLDEADGLTRQSQDSLRNLMEEYSENCFFIFTANDVNKIIEPIKSRCQLICFERPNKIAIIEMLDFIASENDVVLDVEKLVDHYYPDMRRMVNILQESKVEGKPWEIQSDRYTQFFELMKKRDAKAIYEMVYSGDFDYMGFNKHLFHKLFQYPYEFEQARQIAQLLADTEKSYNLGVSIECIFIANILQICKLL